MIPNVHEITGFVRKYRSLIALGCAALFAELGYAILNLSAMPMYVEYVLKRGEALGLIISTFLLTEAVSRPAFGALGDRIGRKPLLVAGPAVTAVTSYLTIRFHSPFVLVGLRALDGLGSGALWPSAFATIGDVVDEENRSTAMSVLNVTYMSGLALGFLMGGAVNEIFDSYLASFYLVSALLVMSVIVILAFFPSRAPKPHAVATTGVEEIGSFKPGTLLRSFREVPDMVVLACVVFLGIGMLMPIVKLYAVQHLGMSETTFGAAVAPIAAAMGLFAVPLGRIGDKYGKCVAVCWGLLASALAMWVLALCKNVMSLHYYIIFGGAAGGVLGLGFTIAFPAWMALVSSATSPDRRGEVLGAVGMAQGLAAIVGTSLGAYVYSSDLLSFPRLGVFNYNVPFWLSAMLLSIGTVLAFTWVCGRHGHRDRGDGVTAGQRTMVVLASVVALVWLSVWVTYRYARPVSPDRVAWCWVQQLVRGRADKAEAFTLADPSAGWDAVSESQRMARKYREWMKRPETTYSVFEPEFIGSDRAVVRVEFLFHTDGTVTRKVERILLRRTECGTWRVCGLESQK